KVAVYRGGCAGPFMPSLNPSREDACDTHAFGDLSRCFSNQYVALSGIHTASRRWLSLVSPGVPTADRVSIRPGSMPPLAPRYFLAFSARWAASLDAPCSL